MKVLYYEKCRNVQNDEHDAYLLECYYIQKEKIILYNTDENVKYDKLDYLITKEKSHLEEAESILQGNIPLEKHVNYYKIKEFEYDSNSILDLIENIIQKKKLNRKIEKEIYRLTNKLENT
ncbi:hypothetical protein HOD61_02665 [archaeon]|jgi:hypothetical protein|nr:hypothetical protein [archaeon]